MSNAKTLHLQFADGEIEVGTLIDALYEQERTIAMLREHKNDYMDAAEGTRKYLEAELAKLRAGQEPVAHVGGCDCSGLCKQRGLASDEVDTDCKAVYGTPATVQSVNQQLLEALEACADALWEDSREVRMDDTMMMGAGYDWDGWENFRWELHTRKGSFAIWPAHGTYSAYGGLDGSYWNQRFASAAEAKAAIVEHVSKIDPTHPASLAHAAIAAAQEGGKV